jgi:hypothetical protein
MKRAVLILAALTLMFGGVEQARAGHIALDIIGGGFASGVYSGTSGGSGTSGWEFTVNSPITIDSLGLWDEGSQPLPNTHQVGLWDNGGNLLASTTITNASTPVASASGEGQWLFNAITPLTLQPGDYIIGAVYGFNQPDPARFSTTVTTIHQITYDNPAVGFNGFAVPFVIPNFNLDSVFGPNFAVASAVPERSTLTLLSLGSLGLLGYGRRRGRGGVAGRIRGGLGNRTGSGTP